MQTEQNPMEDADALTNAEMVIDRFGGIRPMAAKMRVPVTTVQGWKQRNVIPGNRRAEVLQAAQANHIDLSDIVANQNHAGHFSDTLESEAEAQAENPEALRPHEEAIAAARATEAREDHEKNAARVTHEVMMKEIKKAQNRAVQRSMVASIALLAVFAVIYGMLIAINKQQMAQQSRRIAMVEDRVENLDQPAPAPAEKAPGMVESMMQDMNKKFYDLRLKTESLQASVQDLKTQAEDFMNLENSSLVDRIMALESRLENIPAGGTDLSALLARIGEMQKSLEGQQKLEATVAQLQAMVAATQNRPEGVGDALAAEQQSGDSELARTLEGVSPEQLKAAALLIGLSQFRDSLNRSGPFAEDLALLQTMLGDKDPELNAAIAQLAPYAEKGILSPKGLSEELKSLTGEIVVASITGQDVSVQEKAMARFQEVLKIQKDGKPVMGSDAQATIARAQSLLYAGDVDGAIAELESLEGPAREKAQPVIDQAAVTRMAQQVQGRLTNTVVNSIRSGLPGKRVPYTAAPKMKIPALSPDAMGPFLPKESMSPLMNGE